MEINKLMGMGSAYLQSLSAFHLKGKPHPFSAAFMITNKCNLRCSYCNYPLIKTKELNIEEIDTLFNNLKQIGIKRLGISGGEPMVRKDLPEIINLAHSKGFFVSLNSNMLLYDRYKGKLNNVDYFFTSIDGNPEVQKKNRGNDSIDKIIDAIRDIKSMGKKVTIITVISQPDVEAVDYVLKLAIQENVNVHFQPEGYGAELLGRDTPVCDDNESYREIWKYILQKKREGFPITSSTEYLKFTSKWENYHQTALNDKKQRCAAMYGFMFVDPTGMVYPCCYTKGKVKGINIIEGGWKKELFSELPCSTCIGGPYLEYNLLYKKPIRSTLQALKKIM